MVHGFASEVDAVDADELALHADLASVCLGGDEEEEDGRREEEDGLKKLHPGPRRRGRWGGSMVVSVSGDEKEWPGAGSNGFEWVAPPGGGVAILNGMRGGRRGERGAWGMWMGVPPAVGGLALVDQ